MFELQYFIIGIVQGFTEFLPISSSGHLVLVSQLTSWQDQGLFTDVAVHVGTLLAVIIYLRFHINAGQYFEGYSLQAFVLYLD